MNLYLVIWKQPYKNRTKQYEHYIEAEDGADAQSKAQANHLAHLRGTATDVRIYKIGILV